MTAMTEHDFIRDAFRNLNDNVLTLASDVKGTNKEVSELKGQFLSFRLEVLRHFDTCPVDELREHTGQIDIELERLRAKRARPDSDDKISGPPKPPVIGERTIQLLIILAIIALGGIGVAAQLLGG